MKDSILSVRCPCCRADLEVDADTGIVLSHQTQRPKKPSKDLSKAVAEVRGAEARREESFQKAFAAQKKHEGELEQKFEGLFKRQKGKPVERHVREIDLD
ncbi:MAG: hypothetical protein KDC27_09310 [Acidobacteria bacterium]|nr:hypothetical protein [Acidobacteriota bacterium]